VTEMFKHPTVTYAGSVGYHNWLSTVTAFTKGTGCCHGKHDKLPFQNEIH